MKGKNIIKIVIAVVLLCFSTFAFLLWEGILFIHEPLEKNYPVRGIDLSHYQGDVDWKNIKKDMGITFAFIKATEGSGHVDEKFEENWKESQKSGLYIGAYHFFSFDSSGETQAENFIANVPKIEGMLPPVVDVEFYGDKENNPPSKEYVKKELTEILILLENHFGVKPIIYTTEKVYDLYIKNNFNDYDLWIRNVICKPNKNTEWKFWQYTNRETFEGYKGDEKYIDVNVFNGSVRDFLNYPTVGDK